MSAVTDLPPRKALVDLELESRMFASPSRVKPWDLPSPPRTCSNAQCPCHTQGISIGDRTRA